MTELLGLPLELLAPLGDPTHRIFWPFLLTSALVALLLRHAGGGLLFAKRIWLHPSAVLDYQLLLCQALARWSGFVPFGLSAVAVAAGVVRALDGSFGIPGLRGWSPSGVTLAYSLCLFLGSDLSRYIAHRLLHRIPALWELHQVHHSAEVMTPLTFYRGHPLESVLLWLRGVFTTGLITGVFFWLFRGSAQPLTLLGVNVLGFVFNLAGGNLRHSHVWWSFGGKLEWLLMSPAQHQLHHSSAREHHDKNFGAWLSIWDGIGRSLLLAGQRRELDFGLKDEERNHAPDDLLDALLGPMVAAGRKLRRAGAATLLVATLGLVLGVEVAWAEEDDSEDEEEEEDAVEESVSVFGDRAELRRVAGSAHKIEQEELERLEYDDIHRVLAPVPGVYVRDEDGYGLRPNIGIRGVSSERSAKITLMEDGVLLAPAPYSAPAAYYFPMTTRMVGVEVFKGPASIRHGPNTIGGAVNLQTRPVPQQLDGGIDVAMGLRRTFKIHGFGGARAPWGGFLGEIVHLSTDGFKQLDGGGDSGFSKTELMFKGRLNTPLDRPVHSAWELKLGFANERSRETYLGITDEDFAQTPYRRYPSSALGLMTWSRTQVELSWSTQLHRNLRLRVVGYHHGQQRSWRKLGGFGGGQAIGDVLAYPSGGQSAVFASVLRGDVDSSGTDQQLLIGTNARRYQSYGGLLLTHWRLERGIFQQNLEVGLRVHGDQVVRDHSERRYEMRSAVLVDADPNGSARQTASSTGRALAVAAHVQEELGIGPLRLLPGLRVELINTTFADELNDRQSQAFRAAILPGISAQLQAASWLGFFGGAHRGFSPVGPGQAKAAKPEYAWNYEGGARFSHRDTQLEAVGFFSDYSNLTGQCSFSAGCDDRQLDVQFNGGQVHVYGVEATGSQRIRLPAELALKAALSYTWTGSAFQTSFRSSSPIFGSVRAGDKLAYVPEHQGNASLTFLSPLGSAEITVKAQSAQRDLPGSGSIRDEEKVPAFAVVDLAGEIRVSRAVRVYMSVGNLLNSAYIVSRRPFGVRPGRPFNMMVGLKLSPPRQQPGIVDLLAERRAHPRRL